MTWTWDLDKDTANRAKHELPLAAGVPVLDGDLLALHVPDPHPDGDRWRAVGSAGGHAVLFVVYTDPGRRIVSVCKATAHERRQYEELP